MEKRLTTLEKKIDGFKKEIFSLKKQLKTKPKKQHTRRPYAAPTPIKRNTPKKRTIESDKVLSDKEIPVSDISSRSEKPVNITDFHFSFAEVEKAGQAEKVKTYINSLKGKKKERILNFIKSKDEDFYKKIV